MAKRKKNPNALLWVLGVAAVGLVGFGAYQAFGPKPKKSKKKNSYGNDYGKGEVGGDYRKSEGPTTCGNCAYASAKKENYQGTGSGDLYCSFWKTAVRSDYLCNYWQPHES